MARMQLGYQDTKRGRGYLPEVRVVNMYAEKAPTEAGGITLISRPALVEADVLGEGPIRAIFQRDGVLAGDRFTISSSTLYRGAEAIGDIDGTGHVSIAGYENFLFVAAGASLWGYDGTSLTAIPMPDDANVRALVVGGSRLVVIRDDTGQFYWSDVLESDIEALDFATAESQPDRLLDVLFVDDILRLFGAETVELWPNGQNAELPFTPLENAVIERGIKATGCATAFGPTYAFVTNRNEVCIETETNIVSDAALQKRIEESVDISLFTFFIDGVEFLALRMDGETQAYNRNTGLWSEFASFGSSNLIPACSSGTEFGSGTDGRILKWSGYSEVQERRFRAGFPLNASGASISNVLLRCQTGQADLDQSLIIEMRTSRDEGRTWGAWRQASLGGQGQYGLKVQWRAVGMASYPGFFAEFRIVGAADFRVSEALVNEPWGGR